MEQTDLDNLEWRRRRLNCVGSLDGSHPASVWGWGDWGGVAPRQWWSVITGVMWCVGIGSSLLHPDLCHQEDHLNNHYGNKARLLLPSHPDLLHGASCLVVLGEARGHCCDTWSVAAWALCLCWPQVRRGAETMLVSHSRTAPDH